MKTATLQLFLCGLLALNQAAPAFPDTAGEPEEPVPEAETAVVPESEGGDFAETAVVEPDEETFPDAVNDLGGNKQSCPLGWSPLNARCFRYFSASKTWAQAERHCVSMKANLASVHSHSEYIYIQRLISESGGGSGLTWIGGSDAEEENIWFWSDGSPFVFTNWCSGQPDNFNGRQNCLLMNFAASKSWDDGSCNAVLPYVCAK